MHRFYHKHKEEERKHREKMIEFFYGAFAFIFIVVTFAICGTSDYEVECLQTGYYYFENSEIKDNRMELHGETVLLQKKYKDGKVAILMDTKGTSTRKDDTIVRIEYK